MHPLPPDHTLHRYESTAARRSLAARFGLPFDEAMQDWEYEVAIPELYPVFLDAYRSGELDDDERFSLGMMLVQCVADVADERGELPQEWDEVAALLRADPRTHGATVSYWCAFAEPHEWAAVGAAMRRLWREVGPPLLAARDA